MGTATAPFKPGRLYRERSESALKNGWECGAVVFVMSCTVQILNDYPMCPCGFVNCNTAKHVWCELILYCEQWGGFGVWTLDACDFDEM